MQKTFPLLCLLLFSLLGCKSTPSPTNILTQQWGTLPDGTAISLYTLDNGNGLRARITNYGGIIVSLEMPDRAGARSDVVLGFSDLDSYVNHHDYFGALVGRFANRIAHGKFTLDGQTYELPLNNEPGGIPCSLHGGNPGFDKVVWTATPLPDDTSPALALSYLSKDGENGYPGNLRITVTYRLLPNNTLRVEYAATTDKATPVNLSQHSYFNLAGEGNGTILDHQITIHASRYTPVDKGLIPTGEISSVLGTPFDLREPQNIGKEIDANDPQLKLAGGYDHNWVIETQAGNKLRRVADVYEPGSGRHMSVLSDQPGLQFYSGNFLDGTIIGKSGKPYLRRGAFALETQHFPDSPNQPTFPTTILNPGEEYKTVTEFCFSWR